MNPFSKLSDEKLMEEYKGGEYMAFEVLYARHKNTVYTYLHKRMVDKDSVNEVFQNVFMKLHKCRDGYDSKHLFVKWLYTISRSELLDFCKKKKMDAQQFQEQIHSVTSEERSESIDLNEFSNLSANEKEAIKRKFFSDEDYQEISKALETSQSNARKLVSRGIFKMRKKILGGKSE